LTLERALLVSKQNRSPTSKIQNSGNHLLSSETPSCLHLSTAPAASSYLITLRASFPKSDVAIGDTMSMSNEHSIEESVQGCSIPRTQSILQDQDKMTDTTDEAYDSLGVSRIPVRKSANPNANPRSPPLFPRSRFPLPVRKTTPSPRKHPKPIPPMSRN
jgi:hypothetical protein